MDYCPKCGKVLTSWELTEAQEQNRTYNGRWCHFQCPQKEGTDYYDQMGAEVLEFPLRASAPARAAF